MLAVSGFIVIFNEMVMGVVLSHVMSELGITATTGQWLTTAYALTMAVVIPATGFLMKRLNMRPLFSTTMALFSAGTLIAAIAPAPRSCWPGASCTCWPGASCRRWPPRCSCR